MSKVWFGLSKVAVAFIKSDGTYETPVAIPGAVKFTYESSGDQEKFYADNSAYYVASGAAGASGELEMAAFPNSILSRMLGWTIDKNGALVETTDGVSEQFALIYQVDGDVKPRAATIYKMTAAAPKEEWSTTEDGLDVKTTVLPYTAVAVEGNDRKYTKITLEKTDKNAAAYASFFTTVYTPDFTTTSGGEQGETN